MPDRPSVSPEDIPQSVVEAMRSSFVREREALGGPIPRRDESLSLAFTAAMREYERLGYRLVRDDERVAEDDRFDRLCCELARRDAEVGLLRGMVLRQWASAHHHRCGCEHPDTAGCGWTAPITATGEQIDAALTAAQAKSEPANLATAPTGPSGLGSDDEATCREALARLVALKDGPRDEAYERGKPLAWEQARAALTAAQGGEDG